MTLFGRKPGRATGDTGRDIRILFDYIAYLVEQLEYSGNQMEKRLAALEKAAKAKTQEEEG